jgi:SagB-type dehydrogenase family enzyme
MANRDTISARTYHDGTKHSYQSVRSDPHFLDWGNQPRPFKIYPGLEPIPLPRAPRTGVPALAAIAPAPPPEQPRALALDDVAALFYYSAGLTRRRKYPSGELAFRAAACTGALYEIELYAVCSDLAGLAAGIYLYSPGDHSLRRLRGGDFRGVLVRAAAGERAIAHAPVTFVSTGTYWRNAWKYRARTYRHFGWDNGTMLANLFAVAAARGLPARVVSGFLDATVNRLLGLDTAREVALNLVPVGWLADPVPADAGDPPPLELETLPYSHHEVDYPAMQAMHESATLADPGEVAAWRGAAAPPRELPEPAGAVIPLEPAPSDLLPPDAVEDVIERRGSSRAFLRESIPLEALSSSLIGATRGVAADFLAPGAQLNDLYVIVHAVDGIAPGAYVFHRDPPRLETLRAGAFRREAGFLGLEQALPADCSAAVFFLADLDAVLERFGNRGYRAVQLEAGIIGGRLYLAQYTQRLGASGLTFYDDEVTRFFSPHAEGKSAIFLVALGRTAKMIQGW